MQIIHPEIAIVNKKMTNDELKALDCPFVFHQSLDGITLIKHRTIKTSWVGGDPEWKYVYNGFDRMVVQMERYGIYSSMIQALELENKRNEERIKQ